MGWGFQAWRGRSKCAARYKLTLFLAVLTPAAPHMPAYFSDFNAVEAHLAGIGPFHMDMGLARMRDALEKLGLTRPPFRVAQVLGSNGKGSTSTFLASLCAAHGRQCGLYTSPHFVSIRERIRINGRRLPEAEWTEAANILMAAQPSPELTYFEFLTLLALIIFARRGVDAAILEAGLGGQHDATTAIDADLLCFAPIAMDHAAILGNSLAGIAGDKAGAIRSAAPVFSARQFPAAMAILKKKAAQMGASISFASKALPAPFPRERLLAGPHQDANAALALLGWRHLAPMLGVDHGDRLRQEKGLATAFIPGRLQMIGPRAGRPALVLDGGHNPHAMNALVQALDMACPGGPDAIIFSCLADKDWKNGLRILRRAWPQADYLLPQLGNERAADTALVARFVEGCGGRALPVRGGIAVARALDLAAARLADRKGGGLVLVTGSLYLLADFYALCPQYLEAPDLA